MTSERSRSRKNSSSAAARWNRRYREGGNRGEDPSPLLLRAIETLPPGSALELACGAGRNAIALARRGWNVTAIDVSPVAIELLHERARNAKVEIDARVDDLESPDFRLPRNRYDLVCDFYFLARDLFPQMRRAVRPGGRFVGSIHLIDDAPGIKPMNPAYLLEAGELRRQFRRWEILFDREGKPEDSDHDRLTADIIAVRR